MIITNIILEVFPKKNYLKQKKIFFLKLWFNDGVKHSLGSVYLEVCQMLFFKIFFIYKYIIIIYIF
jgi:hypothetical protein